jgi:predicted molibdopterin-dependent oxidoreductase YjgC
MCLVEIQRKKEDYTRIVTSCNYPVEEGLSVLTDSDTVIKNRKVVLELLMARAPEDKAIRSMAEGMGVPTGRLSPVTIEDGCGCIVCGMCVRACEEVVGISALGFAHRGVDRVPTTPYMESSQTCIGCGTCAYICPTNYIKMEDKDGKRFIYNWKVELELEKCEKCGAYIAPKRQLEYIKRVAELPDDFFKICVNCK